MNSDKDRKALTKTIAQENITWQSWWDEGRIDGPIHTLWQIEQRPAIHLIDAKGIIRHRNISPEKVDAAIEALLESMKSSSGTP